MSIFDELPELNRQLRGHVFYGPDVRTAPPLYATEDVPKEEKTVVAHFFLANSEWWIMEVAQDTGIAFGYCVLGGDFQSAELGYVSLLELENISIDGWKVVERDLAWTPRPFSEVLKAH